MEKKINKKKFKLKGVFQNSSTKLILKKSSIIDKNKLDTLILSDEVIKPLEKKFQPTLVKKNIIELNEQNRINKTILKISNLSKNIDGKPILKNISFEIKQGEILGLLGPNGAGKSTLFNLIIGKISPDNGEIFYFNEKINNLRVHERALKGISLLEQHKGLFGNMTAYENLYSILEIYNHNKNKIEEKINQLLSFFDLKYLINVKAENMSGGEYKKISTLQRVCNKNIKILLLDEPMSALDPISISSIKKFILELRNMGLTILITDHNFYAIHDILDNCLIIKDGTTMVSGAPKAILKNELAIKYYLGSGFKI